MRGPSLPLSVLFGDSRAHRVGLACGDNDGAVNMRDTMQQGSDQFACPVSSYHELINTVDFI